MAADTSAVPYKECFGYQSRIALSMLPSCAWRGNINPGAKAERLPAKGRKGKAEHPNTMPVITKDMIKKNGD